MEKKFTLPELGYEVIIGKFAGQADGAAWLQQGGTVVLSTVCSAPSQEFPGFLPLTTDYRELFSATGKIPGGYFKRESKPSTKEVLAGRAIDRAIRPLFPENFFNQVQVLSTVYSADKKHLPQTLALLATSIALTISKIPFMGPVGMCEVARVDGQWIYNPTYDQTLASDGKLIIAGTHEGINMVECATQEISEQEFIDILFTAHEHIKKQVEWQQRIAQELSVQKQEIVDIFDWNLWKGHAKAVLTDSEVSRMFSSDKIVRSTVRNELETKFLGQHVTEIAAANISKTFLKYVFDTTLKHTINELIFKLNKRIDTRSFDTVRPISTEVGLLPCNHGSALFTRGRTQALVSATLGGGEDEARTDDIMGQLESAFMLHYNFLSFSVGEVRPSRGPGRREIGHGNLAESAIKQVLPAKIDFPYTIRLVADILESDGSTSMATVCGSTMALMNAGVPIRTMVSGIAMGLLHNEQGEFQVLTDIAGIEDEFGLMDFKVAGTERGILAIQMDIKYKGGLSRGIFEKALTHAKIGRMHILREMQKVMTKPADLSPLVPQIIAFKIPTEKIGAIIGSQGKVIKEIIEKNSTPTEKISIDIEDDGLVRIFGHPGPLLDRAVSWVKALSGSIERGQKFSGRVKRITEFGLFIEVAPGLDGLVHISMIPRKDQEQFMKSVRVDDQFTVEVVDYESETGRIRLKIV